MSPKKQTKKPAARKKRVVEEVTAVEPTPAPAPAPKIVVAAPKNPAPKVVVATPKAPAPVSKATTSTESFAAIHTKVSSRTHNATPTEGTLFSYRRLLHGIAKYKVHIFHASGRNPICSQPYGVFDTKPLETVYGDEVCPNCQWEMKHGQLRS